MCRYASSAFRIGAEKRSFLPATGVGANFLAPPASLISIRPSWVRAARPARVLPVGAKLRKQGLQIPREHAPLPDQPVQRGNVPAVGQKQLFLPGGKGRPPLKGGEQRRLGRINAGHSGVLQS